MDDNFYPGVFMGVFVGALLTILALGIFGEDVKLRKECEATLPRDQHCVMQFVPEQKGTTHAK